MTNRFLFSLFNYPQQVRHFLNRAAHRRRVGPLDDLIQLPQAQTRNDAFLRLGKGDPAPVILNPNLSRRGIFRGLFLRSHMLCRLQVFHLFAAQARHFKRIFHLEQPVEGRAHDVVRVG